MTGLRMLCTVRLSSSWVALQHNRLQLPRQGGHGQQNVDGWGELRVSEHFSVLRVERLTD